ncbi:MAG: hypothetical protein ACOC56_01060 [Atribacterota bacterium]
MIVAAGPFIGSFEDELFTFRPYVKYLHDNLNHDHFFVSTYKSRFFLYDWLKEESMFENIQEKTTDFDGTTRKSISNRDYQKIVGSFKEEICNIVNARKKDIDIYKLKYKRIVNIPIDNKIFTRVVSNVDIPNEYKNRIVFILNKNNYSETLKLIYHCKNNYNCLVIGSEAHHHLGYNDIYKLDNFNKYLYQYLVEIILNAKCVICSVGTWTFFCNFHGIPVFSWGENVGMYKKGTIYNFDNDCCTVWYKSGDVDKLTSSIDFFTEKLIKE